MSLQTDASVGKTPTETQQQDAAASEKSKTGPGSDAGATGTTSVLDLMRIVLTDPRLEPKDKKLLIDELRKSSDTDRWTYRYAILFLGATVLIAIGVLWNITSQGFDSPDWLVAVASAAVGGLAGLLTPGKASDG